MAGLEPDQREPGNPQQAGEQKDRGTHGVGGPATAQNEAWGRLEKERRIKTGLCCDQMGDGKKAVIKSLPEDMMDRVYMIEINKDGTIRICLDGGE